MFQWICPGWCSRAGRLQQSGPGPVAGWLSKVRVHSTRTTNLTTPDHDADAACYRAIYSELVQTSMPMALRLPVISLNRDRYFRVSSSSLPVSDEQVRSLVRVTAYGGPARGMRISVGYDCGLARGQVRKLYYAAVHNEENSP